MTINVYNLNIITNVDSVGLIFSMIVVGLLYPITYNDCTILIILDN